MSKINFAFWGTPEVSRQTLDILKTSGFLPSFIITATDKPKGRGLHLAPSPVKVWAEENKIPFTHDFADLPAVDLSVVVAYGKIIPEETLNAPSHGSINIHYSLLPKYRGASPVESAILAGETETGVTIQHMVYRLDAGPILMQEKVEIGKSEKSPELKDRLIKLGADMLAKFLENPSFEGKAQDDLLATHSKKINKEDAQIDLAGDPVQNYNKFRAYAEWPRTFYFQDGKRIIITDAELKNGKFVIKKIIPEGAKEKNY